MLLLYTRVTLNLNLNSQSTMYWLHEQLLIVRLCNSMTKRQADEFCFGDCASSLLYRDYRIYTFVKGQRIILDAPGFSLSYSSNHDLSSSDLN